MKERHWTSLVTSLRHGQCVLVLGQEVPAAPAGADGAAVSRNDVSFAEALLRRLAAELEEDGRDVIGDSLSAIAQQYEDTDGFGRNALRAEAEKFYNSGAFAPSPVHRELASLPFSLIATTCHDGLFSRALEEAGKSPVTYRYHLRGDKRDNPEFFLSGSVSSPIVYHLFGNAQEPGSLVLSENDLLDFLIAIVSERPPLPNSLSRALKRNGQSFLFVGFGISQWYLRVLMKVLVRSLELHRTANTIAAESLGGLSKSDRERTILFYQRGTRIEVEDADISEFLTELARRLAAEGRMVQEAPPLGPRPRVFISYAREDCALACQLFEGLGRSALEPWLDEEALIGGEDWDQRINNELAATDYTLVLYTPASAEKPTVT
jgi:SIR2-like domain/TIR domain